MANHTHDRADFDPADDCGCGEWDDGGRRRGRRGIGNRFTEFVRTRRTEHWIMFAGGLVIGVIIG